MAKKKSKKSVSDARWIESEIIDKPLDDDPQVTEDTKVAQWIYGGYVQADKWFDEAKREEFDYAEKVSISSLYTSWQTLSQICQPDTENAVRAGVAKDIVSIFIKKPFAKVTGVSFQDYPDAKEVDKALQVLFTKMPDFLTEMVDFVQQRRIYGTAIGKVIYRDIKRKVKVVDEDEEGNVTESQKDVTVYSGAIVQCVDVKESFRIDPTATKLDGFWKYHRFVISYKTLLDGEVAGKYINIKRLVKPQKLVKNEKGNNARPFADYEQAANNFMDEDLVECVEAWSPDDFRYVIAIGHGPVLISRKDQPNPYGRHPFFCSTINKPPKKFYGRGTPSIVRPQQEWLDIICNVINDVSVQNAAPMFSDPDNLYPASVIPYVPWGVVHTQLIPFLKPNLPSETYQLKNDLKQAIEDNSGATRISSSIGALTPSQSNMKATVYAGSKATQNERHAYDLFMLDDCGLVEMVRRVVWLMVACANADTWQEMTGQSKVNFSWQKLPIDLDFEATLGIDTLSNEMVQTNLMYLLTQIVPIAAKIGLNVDLPEMINLAFQVANLDPDRFIKPAQAHPPQVQPGMGENLEQPSPVGGPGVMQTPMTQNQYRLGLGGQ